MNAVIMPEPASIYIKILNEMIYRYSLLERVWNHTRIILYSQKTKPGDTKQSICS